MATANCYGAPNPKLPIGWARCLSHCSKQGAGEQSVFVYAQRFQSHAVRVPIPVSLFSSFVSLVKLSFLSFFLKMGII